ncbi:MAG: hypothetical protein J3Q66DRAFT_410810 [Benniella sp.]|nr:MAG: hypothetical protein J3Q66DRAFT_410810 [Benniella sp.]
MPVTVPTPSINISAPSSSSSSSSSSTNTRRTSGTPGSSNNSLTLGFPSLSNSLTASSPFTAEALAAATALRRPSLVLSMGSFHSGQLRRSSFFAPFSYGQSPHQYDALSDLSTSPRRGDVYQRDLEANYCSNFSCCGLTLGDLHALLQHYEESHVRFEEEDDNGHPVLAGFVDEDAWTSTGSESNNNNSHSLHLHSGRHTQHSHLKSASSAAAALAASQQQEQKLTPLSF